MEPEFLARGVNDGFSGGEKKRMETLQLAVLGPKFAVLDEIDSGLDVDALRDVSRRVEAMTEETDLGVLAITHYARLLTELRPDRVHVLDGRSRRRLGRTRARRPARGDGLRGSRRRPRRRADRARRTVDARPTRSPTPASDAMRRIRCAGSIADRSTPVRVRRLRFCS